MIIDTPKTSPDSTGLAKQKMVEYSRVGLHEEIKLFVSLDVRTGENLGDIMKQPKLSDLALNVAGTKKIRELAAKSQKIKITINIDKDSLDSLKEMALKTGGSYQKILNGIVKSGLEKRNDSESRLQKLEKEVAKIKKKIAA